LDHGGGRAPALRGHPPRREKRAEIRFSPGAFEALVTPLARDGNARARSPQDDSESAAKTTARVHPQAPFPDDPETLAAREEALAQFRATLPAGAGDLR
jgi:hypothetical protein